MGVYTGTEPVQNQQVRIYLKQGGDASVQATYDDRLRDFFAEGKWQRLADGRIAVDVRQERLVFRQRGDQLLPEDWDRNRWGERGPGVVYRVR